MTVAMAIYNVLAEAIVIIIIQPYKEKYYSFSFFSPGLDMSIALDIAMAMAMATASPLL